MRCRRSAGVEAVFFGLDSSSSGDRLTKGLQCSSSPPADRCRAAGWGLVGTTNPEERQLPILVVLVIRSGVGGYNLELVVGMQVCVAKRTLIVCDALDVQNCALGTGESVFSDGKQPSITYCACPRLSTMGLCGEWVSPTLQSRRHSRPCHWNNGRQVNNT